MDPTRESRAEELFAEAIELPEAERLAFLDERCDDPELRVRVDSLLRAHAGGGDIFRTQDLQKQIREFLGSVSEDPAGRRISHYRIVERLGAGGMGEVFRARDEHLPRDVAIKILPAGTFADDQARKRFRKEAEALSRLNHPHIATIYDFDTQDGLDFLVMEFVEGKTLGHRMREERLPPDEQLRIASEIAEALDEAHHHGIVHRDLKPGNVGLTRKGKIKLLDFGLARVSGPSTDSLTTVTLTGTPAFAGTLPYMAPEQLRGATPDHRSDLYALGVVLYEMATGRRPFEREPATALIDDVMHRPPSPPSQLQPDLLPGLEPLILNCLEKDPAVRYQSAQEVLADLRRIGAPTHGFGHVRRRGVMRRLARRRVVAVAGGVILVGAAMAALVGFNVGGLRDNFFGPAAPGPIASIVALPSEVFATPDDAYLTDAVPRTLSTYLNQVEGLETKMPPTSFEVERLGRDLEKIARIYAVSALVVSTVTARSNQFTLNLQLVEAQTRRLLWSHEYDGSQQEFLELVRAGAEGLREAIRPLAARLPAVSAHSEPEILFQRGLYHSNRYNNQRDPEDLERAKTAFQKVLELDPRRADAAAEISNLYGYEYEFGSNNNALEEIKTWALRATEIDPLNAIATGTLSAYEFYSGNYQSGLRIALRSVALAPRNALLQNGLADVICHGSIRLGLEGYVMAARLDPLYTYPPLNLAHVHGLLGRSNQALAVIDGVLDLEPDMPFGLIIRATQLILLGRTGEASSIVQQLEAPAGGGQLAPGSLQSVRALLAVQTSSSPIEVDSLLSWGQNLFFLRELLTMLAARRGEIDLAFSALSSPSDSSKVPPYDWLMLCPDLQPLGGDPRFAQVATKSRQHFEAMLAIFDEARGRGEFPTYLEKPLSDLLADLRMPARD